MGDNKSNTTFHYDGLRIMQRENVFKIGTDAILLGAWSAGQIQHAESILDVGTGTGILALMLSRKFPDAIIEGLDIDPDAVELASHNFLNEDNSGRITARLCDLFSEASDKAGTFDMIICNPPFFQSPIFVKDKHRKISRHTVQAHEHWIKALRSRLREIGHLFLVIPSSKAYSWLEAANKEGLYCAKRLDVFTQLHDAQPVRSLLQLQMQLMKPEINSICIYERPGVYSKESMNFWNPF